MSENDFLFWSAAELVAAFKSKELSPVEVTSASLARAEKVQARCNPITEFFAETALAAAKKAEARYAASNNSNGGPRPLEGVPMAVKEEFALCGSVRASGSLLFADKVDEHTDVYIQRLLDGGAIPIVKRPPPNSVYWDRHGHDVMASPPTHGIMR